MSIYCTLWEMSLPYRILDDHVLIYAQGVPGHIGRSDCGYDHGDPYSFLPPVVDEDSLRAVIVVMDGYEEKDGQRYVSPLLVLTGEEYKSTPFPVMLKRLQEAIEDRVAPPCGRWRTGRWSRSARGWRDIRRKL